MAQKKRIRRIAGDKFNFSHLPFYLYLIPLAVFMGFPIVFIACHAFKPMDELFAFPPQFFVHNPSLVNFRNLLQTAASAMIPMSRYIFNSVIVTGSVVILAVIFSSMGAFALSKMEFKGKKVLFEINNAALMFVPAAVTIPRYLTMDKLGIINTYFAHILPLLVMPVGLFLIKQFMDQVPDSLIEAAVLDGASDAGVYFRIILPMVKPALATCAILSFQMVWNNIETSNLFTSTESIRTLAFYMNTLSGGVLGAAATGQTAASIPGQGIAAAASLILFIPNLLLFIIMQGNVMNTMAHSGIK